MYSVRDMRKANLPYIRYSGSDRCEKCLLSEPMCWKFFCSDEQGTFYYTDWPKVPKPRLVERLKNIFIGE